MSHQHDQDPADDNPLAEPLRPAAAPQWTLDEAPADSRTTTEPVAFSTRTPGPSRLRVGAVAGAAVALAVGAVATSFAASPGPSASTAVTTGVAGGSTRVGAAPLFAIDPTIGIDDDAFDHRGRGGMGFHDITVSAISGDEVTLKTDDGWTRTIAVTDAVTVTKGGQEIAVSDLAVGDEVRIEQTRNDDGTYTVTALVVVVPTVHGTASSVTSGSFKVTNRDGSVWTITTNESTQYEFGSADGSASDLVDGAVVVVQGTVTGDNAMTALTVRIAPDQVAGTVTSKTSDTIVITKRDGSTVTVHVDSSTTYRVAGVDTAGLDDVAVDMQIGVSGRERSDGSIDADTVVAGDGRGMFHDGGMPGFGGRGGHGPGGWDDDGDSQDATPTPTPTTSS
jgi:hypothetical protein